MIELHAFLHLADVAVVHPLALLLLPAPTHIICALPILFVIREAAYVMIAIGIDESAIAVHLVVVDLALVDCTIIYNIPTDTSHIIRAI